MPNMPTFAVTDAQAARLLGVFGSPEEFRAWYKQTVIEEVLRREADLRLGEYREQERQRRQEARVEYGIEPVPVPPPVPPPNDGA